jgi:hypothetical protein
MIKKVATIKQISIFLSCHSILSLPADTFLHILTAKYNKIIPTNAYEKPKRAR